MTMVSDINVNIDANINHDVKSTLNIDNPQTTFSIPDYNSPQGLGKWFCAD